LDIPRQLSDAGVTGNVLLQWHGGEPLLIDPERCEGLIIGLNANTQGLSQELTLQNNHKTVLALN
jgi:sulfatase maturation enzyme AslB (radical SAM superfamily)